MGGNNSKMVVEGEGKIGVAYISGKNMVVGGANRCYNYLYIREE
jgi:hypothetical protein